MIGRILFIAILLLLCNKCANYVENELDKPAESSGEKTWEEKTHAEKFPIKPAKYIGE